MNRVREDFEPVLFPTPGTRSRRPREGGSAGIRRTLLGRETLQPARRSVYLDRPSQPGRDVICAGMYRACSTWQYEVAGHLVEHHLKGQRLGYVTGESYASLGRPTAGRRSRGYGRPWRVLKSHEGDRSFSRALDSGQALAVYAYRDLRDVIFSLMHKRGTSFRELLRQGMIHQLLANDRFWRTQPRVLVQRYEDLIADPVTGVVQLARHLGLGVARREAAEIADDYSLASNRTRIKTLRRRLRDAGIDLHDPANLRICDSTTLLHWNHLRPVHSCSWRTDATSEQRALMARICGPWLAENGYETTEVQRALDGTARVDLTTEPVSERDLAIGRVVFLLRSAASRYPRTTRRLKRLLGIRDRDPGAVIAWPVESPQS
jgi:hypothetical protein